LIPPLRNDQCRPAGGKQANIDHFPEIPVKIVRSIDDRNIVKLGAIAQNLFRSPAGFRRNGDVAGYGRDLRSAARQGSQDVRTRTDFNFPTLLEFCCRTGEIPESRGALACQDQNIEMRGKGLAESERIGQCGG
jgi:hypothetical protein